VRDIGRRLVASGSLARPDDIFMLRWHEIDELLAGREMFAGSVRDLVRLRAQSHAAVSSHTPPDSFSLPRGRTWTSFDQVPEFRRPEVSDADTACVLRGVAASSGRVTGRAAVLADIGDAARLTGGDVLVTRQTDPGWAPVFGLISGLVIERGGLLSHGAVIAREFGVPCVAGIPQATRRIAHGAIVTVDGDAGVCTIHDPCEPTRTEP
jgi:pyruvate,water dikinase